MVGRYGAMNENEGKKIGISSTISLDIDDVECKEITFLYEEEQDDGTLKVKDSSVKFFPNRRIASIAKVDENMEPSTIELGMSREEVIRFFPPHPKHPESKFNLKELLMSIMYESNVKDGLKLEKGSVRHFWYTHLKHILLTILNLDAEVVDGSINGAWDNVIRSTIVKYEEMNITGGKETGRISICKDSPYNNILIGIEKGSYLGDLAWLPHLFNCTLMAAGGDPSRAVVWRFVLELKELGVDLNQTFYLCTATDYDAYGYFIQDAFRKQFEAAIRGYGGNGKMKVHRLFVTRDQITDKLAETQAMPFGSPTQSYSKKSNTIWKRFCKKADGGLYILKPSGWKGYTVKLDDDGKEVKTDNKDEKKWVRAIVEMDVFSNTLIERAIKEKLLEIIRETNDESKIMIPEIMRVFDEQRKAVADELYDIWDNELIEPMRDDFKESLEDWENEIENEKHTEDTEIDNRYNELFGEKQDEKEDRVPELYDEKDKKVKEYETVDDEFSQRIKVNQNMYNRLIEELKNAQFAKSKRLSDEYNPLLSKLRRERENIWDEINEKCKDINEEIEKLEEEKQDELNEVEEYYNFRTQKIDEFKEDHLATFNPVEETLKSDIEDVLNPKNLLYFFRELEQKEEIQKHIAKLLIDSDYLLKSNISCFDQPVPTFKGERFLEKASENKDLNIGRVRDAFSDSFKGSMKKIIRTDALEFSFELRETVDMSNLEQEIKDYKREIEKELEEKENE